MENMQFELLFTGWLAFRGVLLCVSIAEFDQGFVIDLTKLS